MALAVEAPPAGYKQRLDDDLDLEGAGAKGDDVVVPLSAQHVIFLDVDGVVNDLGIRYEDAVAAGTHHIVFSQFHNGVDYKLAIPKNIVEPVQYLVNHYEVHWLSTWREYANNEIAGTLGIEPLPHITDGTYQRNPGWKWRAALPTAKQALSNGKHVYWIEDFGGSFGGRYVDLSVYGDDRFHFIDTQVCLQPYMLKEAGLM